MFWGETSKKGQKSPGPNPSANSGGKGGINVMKKYLALLLCFSFLLGNPVEAAVSNDQNTEAGREFSLTSLAKRGIQNKKGITGGNGKVCTNKKAGKIKKHEPVQKTGQYSPADLELLARLVHAEAQGEPFEGKIAVAATVLNRTEDPYYPDTIPEVIYDYDHGYQYCPVRNGSINGPADEQAWKAVEEALQGEDPSGGALSFFNPSQSANAWICNRPYLIGIGNHVFVK